MFWLVPEVWRTFVGSRPHTVAKQARNLIDTLVHSEHVHTRSRNSLTDTPQFKGMYPCAPCGIWSYVDLSKVFTDSERKKIFKIQHLINCANTWVLYILECTCKKLYIGKTKRQLRIRISEHLKSIKLKKETPVTQHFLLCHYGKSSGLRFKDFFALNLPARRGDFDWVFLKILDFPTQYFTD